MRGFMARVYFDKNGNIVAEGHGIASRVKDERYRLLQLLEQTYGVVKKGRPVVDKYVPEQSTSTYPINIFNIKVPLYASTLYIYNSDFLNIENRKVLINKDNTKIPITPVLLYITSMFKETANNYLEKEYTKVLDTQIDGEEVNPSYLLDLVDSETFIQYPLHTSKSVDLMSDALKYLKELYKKAYEFNELTEKERVLFKEAIRLRIQGFIKELPKSSFVDFYAYLKNTITEHFVLFKIPNVYKKYESSLNKLFSIYYTGLVAEFPLKVDQTICMVEDPEKTYALLRLEKTNPALKKEIEEERKRTESDKKELIDSFAKELNLLMQNYNQAFEQYKNMGIIHINGKVVKGEEAKIEDIKKLASFL